MPSIRQQHTGTEESVRRMVRRTSYGYSLHRRKRCGQLNLVFRPRHKVVLARVGFSRCLDSRKGWLPSKLLDYWGYKVSKKRGQDPRNVRDIADQARQVCVWEGDTADVDSLGQRLVRSLDGGAL
ncbi:MAG: hypothetical protein OXU77_22485 [Gammaproteobacteria bacterium]|nr:hypothetical protein [Gammaproteobacteria bacterium]MDE0435621.1 hypothetical protein [Bryobacterales bacterium]